jgi:CubicO group peptidase (beta-lactamase class C family)
MRPGVVVAAAALSLLPVMALAQQAAAPAVPVPTGVANVGPATGPVSKLPAERVEAIEVAITNLMAGAGIPGLSVAAAHHGELVFASGYGFADLVAANPDDAE